MLDLAFSFLLLLGSSSDDIALNLRFNGIKGKRDNCYNCPLDNYLYYKFRNNDLRISKYHLYYKNDKYCLPLEFQEFIDNFDEGVYPFLEYRYENIR